MVIINPKLFVYLLNSFHFKNGLTNYFEVLNCWCMVRTKEHFKKYRKVFPPVNFKIAVIKLHFRPYF